jgi:hypothetical protein
MRYIMQHMKYWMVVLLLTLTTLSLVACSRSSAETIREAPVKVEAVAGSEFNHITLTERAAERLGIQSESVREEAIDGGTKKVVPYAAIIYGVNGETWAYIRNPDADSLTFVRVPLTVERIEGDLAILSEGPELGAEVITMGVAELYGADTGVGK